LVWDNLGANVNIDLGVNSLVYTYTTSASLTAGSEYRFKYRAVNEFGPGAYSDIVTVRAADFPGKVLNVVTAVENQYVKVSWDYPTDNSSPITQYLIKIKTSAGVATYIE
jgi:hypothetical protein